MGVPQLLSIGYTASTGILAMTWSENVTWQGGQFDLALQMTALTQYVNDGSAPLSGNGTTTPTFTLGPTVADTYSLALGMAYISAGAFVSDTAAPNVAYTSRAFTFTGPCLTTLAAVKSQLGITDTNSDTLLGSLIVAAERQIGLWCDRRDELAGMSTGASSFAMWMKGNHTENRPGALKETITARYWPVESVTSAIIYSSGQSSYTLGTYLYRVDDNQRTIRYMGQQAIAWDAGLIPADYPFNVAPIQTEKAYPYTQLNYVGGFIPGSVPYDLAQAVIELVKLVYNQRKRDWTLTSETLGDYSYTGLAPMMAQYRDDFTNFWLSSYLGIGGGVV